MRALVLWSESSSPNLGVRVLAEGSATLIRLAWPGAEVEHQNYGHGGAPMNIGVTKSLVKERLTGQRGLRNWVRSFDLVLDTRAGDSFTDAYGRERHLLMSTMAEFVHQSPVPLVLGPQTVGPFRSRGARVLARRSLATAAAVFARDTLSARCAADLGRPVDLTTTDVVFALPAPARTHTRDVVLNVSGLLWAPNPHVDWSRYRQQVTRLATALRARGRDVTLLAHVLSSGSSDNDVPAVQELAAELGGDVEVVVPDGLPEVRDVVASAELVIGSRMHACLNALSVGTPAIPLAYSRKFAPLLGDLGWEHTVDLNGSAEPAEDVLRLLEQAEDTTEQIATLLADARDKVDGAARVLRAVV